MSHRAALHVVPRVSGMHWLSEDIATNHCRRAYVNDTVRIPRGLGKSRLTSDAKAASLPQEKFAAFSPLNPRAPPARGMQQFLQGDLTGIASRAHQQGPMGHTQIHAFLRVLPFRNPYANPLAKPSPP